MKIYFSALLLFLSFNSVGLTEGVTQQDAEKLLNIWQKSQNSQDFTSYSSLYSAKFKGIKRTGKTKTTFDRAHWLKDREKMFKAPFSVEVESVKFEPKGSDFNIEFYQSWKSENFRDKGWKILQIVKEPTGIHIISEEQKYSNVGIAKPKNFIELLAQTEEVSPLEYVPDYKISPEENRIRFKFTRELGEGGREEFEGTYRKDGTLEEVTQKQDYSSHSMGPQNKNFAGTLHRKYSSDGKLQSISGNLVVTLQSNGKTVQKLTLTNLETAAKHFIVTLPPLKAPLELLK